jgi:uncharacterized integral membrane protein
VAHEPEEQRHGDKEYTESGLGGGAIIAGIVAVAALIFVLQNSDKTTMEFLSFSATVPLSFVIIVSMILGAILGWFLAFMRRRRRRNRND